MVAAPLFETWCCDEETDEVDEEGNEDDTADLSDPTTLELDDDNDDVCC